MRRTFAILIAALVAVAVPSAAQAAPGPDNGTQWYLALGDSLAAGYQPTTGDDKTGGYVGGVLEAVRTAAPKTKLVNLACSGATTTSLMGTDRCSYDEGSQLAQAVEFLHAHRSHTTLVTIDIGANDVTPCARPTVDVGCALTAVNTVRTNLTSILTQLRAAAGPDTRIVVLNYYNPFFAAWLTGPAGQVTAALSALLQGFLNQAVAAAAVPAGARVADVATAFHSTDGTLVSSPFSATPIPTNVATICAWTWMCLRGDIHANDTGYAVIAGVVVGRLQA